MKYIYGPIQSRRLGVSLGVSLTPHKVCSFDCIYCQLGPTTQKEIQRKEYNSIYQIFEELRTFLQAYSSAKDKIDYITLAGFGEPTLNENIGALIERIKKLTSIPVAVLTNSSLFSKQEIRQALLNADMVMPTLCSVQQSDFELINRPAQGLQVSDIMQGLIEFRRAFRGKLWLEIMVIKGVNDSVVKVKQIKEFLQQLKPDKVFLNSPVRPPSETFIEPADRRTLVRMRESLGVGVEVA
ncbi:radical SAM protein [Candidatus Omnitrophota bacterium]